jgi:hypothetical protein
MTFRAIYGEFLCSKYSLYFPTPVMLAIVLATMIRVIFRVYPSLHCEAYMAIYYSVAMAIVHLDARHPIPPRYVFYPLK